MVILVNHKEAALKRGTSFEFVSENRFFTGADSYTLSITFPLKGCSRNLDIFGHINRNSSDLDTLLLDCEIHDREFHKYGSISIVEISDEEVKTQFLEGRSARNFFSDLDEVYINELDLGVIDEANHFTPDFYWRSIDDEGCPGWVALPWVNNTSGNIQNSIHFASNMWFWDGAQDEYDLSPQVYLLWLAKRIADEVGLVPDFSVWERSEYRHLVVFNTFPAAWDYKEIAAPLPHWSVNEFFHQLELLLNCEFEIDQKRGKISMTSNVATIASMGSVVIDRVIDSYSVEISDEEETDSTYIEQINLEYSEGNHNMQKYYSCRWLVEQLRKAGKVVTWGDLPTFLQNMRKYSVINGDYPGDRDVQCLHYIRKIDTYFLLRCYKATYDKQGKVKSHFMRPVPVNVFGPRILGDDEEPSFTDIGIVPVCIDDVDNGFLPFLECGTFGESDQDDDDTIAQPFAMKVLADGEKEEAQEYFDKIYVGFWDGVVRYNPYMPHPVIDKVEVSSLWTSVTTNYSLRLSSAGISSLRDVKHRVDQSRKYTFSFLSKTVPDVKSVFFIHGRRYLCEKLTLTMNENGRSEKIKGVFYRLER